MPRHPQTRLASVTAAAIILVLTTGVAVAASAPPALESAAPVTVPATEESTWPALPGGKGEPRTWPPGAAAKEPALSAAAPWTQTGSRAPVVEPAPAAPTPTPPPPPPPPPPPAPEVPTGKGMWIWIPEAVEGGDPGAIVARAKAAGLTHILVRTGSTHDGFYAAPFLDQILPVAHAAGLDVYGWDFPYLDDPIVDVERAKQAIHYMTPSGHRIDGFVPDIETHHEGVNLSSETVVNYSRALRAAVGPSYLLIGCVPNPTDYMVTFYPYVEATVYFDAVAPMVYWLNRQPDVDVKVALERLAPLGKPVIPVGQAYDGGPEGGRPGPPTPDELQRFMGTAAAYGARGVSFWSWQHATDEVWATIATTQHFRAG